MRKRKGGDYINSNIIEARNIKKYFPVNKGIFSKTVGWVKSVDSISFQIKNKETFGLVGESGCGKSTTAKLILRIHSLTDGELLYKGKKLSSISKEELQQYRESVQAVFQDPTSSLNPRMHVFDIISEPLRVKGMKKNELNDRIMCLLELVKLQKHHTSLYPHEFSGGQRQRIAIARALSTNPDLVVLDEPISALDVSIRSQILNLLLELQNDFGLSYLLIAHDLGSIFYMSKIIGVMYAGKIVEIASCEECYRHSAHPYTKALLAAAFHSYEDPEKYILQGEVASPLHPPSGCYFHPRCPHKIEKCRKEEPELREIGVGHRVSCHLV